MKKVIILFIILLSNTLISAHLNEQYESGFLINQDLDTDQISKEIRTKSNSLRKIINKKVHRTLYNSAEQLLVEIVKTASGVYYEQMGKDAVNERYPELSDAQTEVLSFYILARVASELDRKNLLAEEDSLRLQLYRDRRDKLYTTLLGIMEKIVDVSEDSIKKIK